MSPAAGAAIGAAIGVVAAAALGAAVRVVVLSAPPPVPPWRSTSWALGEAERAAPVEPY